MRTANMIATVSAASSASAVYELGDYRDYAIGVNFSGSNVAGDLKLQASVDNTTFVDITGSAVTVTSSADHIWNITDAQYRYVKVVWTTSSGTGNITVDICLKDRVVRQG